MAKYAKGFIVMLPQTIIEIPQDSYLSFPITCGLSEQSRKIVAAFFALERMIKTVKSRKKV